MRSCYNQHAAHSLLECPTCRALVRREAVLLACASGMAVNERQKETTSPPGIGSVLLGWRMWITRL